MPPASDLGRGGSCWWGGGAISSIRPALLKAVVPLPLPPPQSRYLGLRPEASGKVSAGHRARYHVTLHKPQCLAV